MTFTTCAEIGRVNIPKSDPAYKPYLDRDKDGIACEAPVASPSASASASPSASPSKSATPSASASASASPTPSKSAVAGVQQQPRLPVTGPGDGEAAFAIGGVLLLVGAALAVALRKRKARFVA